MTHMGEEELDADFGKVLAELAWLKISLGEAYREVSDAFADVGSLGNHLKTS